MQLKLNPNPRTGGVAEFPAFLIDAEQLAVSTIANVESFTLAATQIVNEMCIRRPAAGGEFSGFIPSASCRYADNLGFDVIMCQVNTKFCAVTFTPLPDGVPIGNVSTGRGVQFSVKCTPLIFPSEGN